MVLVGGVLSSASPALAASPLAWSSPTLIDSQPPQPELDGVSCPSAGLCVAVDAFGNVVTSTEPTGGAATWVLANVDAGNRIYGLSCMSGPLCVAVDGAGDVVISTDPAGGTGQWSVAHVDSGHELLGISCVSGPLCVAVDNGGNVITSTDPTGGEHAWTVTHVDDHLIRDVSCASTSLCVAVDANGDVITSTDPTGGSGAWTVSDVDSDNYILGISCPSAGLCVAVDGVGNVLTSTNPAGGTAAWSATGVDAHVLGGVSCSSESLCVAADEAGDVLISTKPTKGKSAWSTAHVDPADFLYGVSCTTGLCIAVNGNGDVFSSTSPTTGAAGWSTAHVDSANPVWLLDVSCPSTGLCVALDDRNDVVSSTNPTGGERAWSTRSLGEEEKELFGLSCPSITLCVAGGESYVDASRSSGSANTWTRELSYYTPVELYREGEEIFGPFASVSCASESLCVASLDTNDEFDTLQTSTDPLGGETAWTRVSEQQMVGSANKPPPHDEDPIFGVSCASALLCAAVDLAGNVLTSTEPGSEKGVWTRAPVDIHPLWGISCPSDSLCVAVDGAGDVVTSTDPTGGANAWSVTNVDGEGRLTGVSCASESLCVAVDAAGNVLSSTDPAGGSAAWSVVPLDAGHTFTSVSCTPAATGLCVAVDNAGYAVTSTFSPQTVTPANTSAPVASGTRAPGQALSCSNGSWTGYPPPTFIYQWLRDDAPIGGATTSTYTVQTADQGHGLTCQVTASNSAGSESATSNTLQVPAAQAAAAGGAGSGSSGGSSGGGGNPGTLTGTVSNAFVLNGIETVAARGTVKVTLTLPGSGTLQIVGEASAAQLAGVSRTKKKRETTLLIAQLRLSVSKSGRIVVTLVPTSSAKTVLARRGKLKATVTITYTPKGGEPRSIVRLVTFRLKRRR